MTVWIENPFDNLPDEGNRPQRYWLMARAFAAAGHETTLWTSDFSHARKERRTLACGAMEGEACGFHVVLVPTRPYRRNVGIGRILSHRAYARRWAEMARARARAEGQPDVLIVSAPPLATGAVALALKREWNCRLVVDVMDVWPETFARLLPRALRGLSPLIFAPAFAAARRLYRGADLVTGVAERYAEVVRRAGAANYFLAYHGIERSAVAAANRPERAGGAVRLVYCGNLGRGYDLATAVRAVARANADLTLDIAGAGETETALKRLATELGVTDRVHFHGYLGAEPLARLLAACDVGLVPLADETCVGVPYKLADYAAAGLRIASSLGGETAALLGRFRCGTTYRPGEPDDLLRAVRAAAVAEAPTALAELFDARHIYADYVGKVCPAKAGLRLSVVVPSRSGTLPSSLTAQTDGRIDVEVVLVAGISPVGRARNEGLRRARGEYVAWVDDDDEIADGWLDALLAATEGGADVVTIDAEYVGWRRRKNCVWGVTAAEATPARLIRDVYRDLSRPSMLVLYVARRRLWEGLSFDEEIEFAEDYLLLPHVLRRVGGCRYVPQRLYRYRHRNGSLTDASTTVRDAEAIGIWQRRLNECPAEFRSCCRIGLAVGCYWLCCRVALDGDAGDSAAMRDNVATCRTLIGHSLAVLICDLIRASDLPMRERILWLLRFVCATLDFWLPQRIRHRGRA